MKKIFAILILIFSVSTSLMAEEGMWLLDQIKDLNLKEKGLKINVKDIYNPDGISLTQAIVNLGGASAELVSPDGLLLTNHHVAFGAVQRASIKGDDYITKGFYAKNREEEIPAFGSTARVIKEIRDVTSEVLDAAKGISDPVQRQRAIRNKIQNMTDAIEKGHEDITARIAEMYEGMQYILFVQQNFQDVRLVYVPPQSIGNYGADIDNWMWPRHTGDFSFMRVYMAPDGSGRKYNKENIPYKPQIWLKVAKEHQKDGDFTFIMGYPGRTSRYKTSSAVDYSLNYYYPESIKNYHELIHLLEEKGSEGPIISRKVAGFLKGLNNTMKNYQGNVDGMKAPGFLAKKQAMEKELQKFIEAEKTLKKEYGNVLTDIGALYKDQIQTRERDEILSAFRRMAGTLPRMANQIVYNAYQRSLPEDERDPRFSEQDIERSLERLRFSYMSYDESVDKAVFKRILQKAEALPADLKINGLEKILTDPNSIDAYLDNAYSKTVLADMDQVKELYTKQLDEIKKMDDPLIQLAIDLYPEFEKQRDENEKRDAVLSELTKKYIEVLSKWKKQPLYPDANGTIRFTYGNVMGYSPRDAVYYKPFTTLTGVIEKDTGEFPFDVPEKLKELYAAKDYGKWKDPVLGDVPVAFLHQCDITGGNSGSPAMNAKGELIGIAFDGNYEALTGDWEFNPEIQRTISVDIWYVLFITQKFAGAEYILKEMGL